MGCPDYAVLTKNLTFTVQAKGTSGAPSNADSLPTYKVYEEETGTEIISGTMALLDDANTTGFYSEQLSITGANGYESYKSYAIRVLSAIGGVSVAKTFNFIVIGESDTITGASGSYLTTTARYKSYAGITSSDDDTLIGLLVARATSAIQRYCQRDFVSTTYRDYYDGDGCSEICLDNYPIINVTMLGIGRDDAINITNTSSDAYHAYVTVTDTTMQLVVQGGDNEDDTSLTLANYATLTLLIAAIEALDKGWSVITPVSDIARWSAIELLPTGKGLYCLEEYAAIQIPAEPAAEYTTDNKAGIIKLWGRFTRGFHNVIVRYTAGYATIPDDLEQICIDLVKIYYDNREVNLLLSSENIGDYSYVTKAGTANYSLFPKHISTRLEKWRSRRI